MAEQDNLESLDDDLDADLGEDIDADLEEGLDDDLDDDLKVPAIVRILTLLKDRRIQIALGAVVGGIILIVSVWMIFFTEKPKPGLANRSALEATLNQERLAKDIAKKKSQKKNKHKKIK